LKPQVKPWSTSIGGESPDRFLWVSFRSGDKVALEKLYSIYSAGMYRYGIKLCGDSDLVKDGMQDLFSRLWSTREQISDAGCVQMYLYRSLRRAILLQVVKKRKRQIPLTKSVEAERLDYSIEDQVIVKEISKEQFERLRNKLGALTKHQREAVVLRFFNGLSYKQIAEIMGLRVDSVYNLTSKAIEILRSCLSGNPNTSRFALK
jgi:RNA polymerase sigma factor (sigma-70 family)